MRKLFLLLILNLTLSENHAQCPVPGGEPDTLFPVINNYNVFYDPDIGHARMAPSHITRLQKRDSSLFLAGYFTNLVSNYGRGIIVNENTQAIITKHKWRINDEVKAAIPDGHGGYYIAGSFSKVGDSVRNFIAQIDSLGRPTAWTLKIDSTVHALYKKNDTLYIGGAFKTVKTKSRLAFATYSISGDSVLPGTIILPGSPPAINVFKAYNDTLILGGYGILKYNMKTLNVITWSPAASIPTSIVESLDISLPHKILFFTNGSGSMIAIDLFTGVLKYSVQFKNHTIPLAQDYAKPTALVVIGNKLYIGGSFQIIFVNAVRTDRKGLCVIDIPTGSLINKDFALDNIVTNLFSVNDKLYVSGFFTSISGIQREHFAELDTTTLGVSSWNPSPSDPVRCVLKNNGKIFFGGLMNGIGSIHRNQLAEINVVTREIKPFSMPPTYILYVERFFVKDSLLYLLCVGSELDATQERLIVVNMNNRQITNLTPASSIIYDIAIDDMYLYVSTGAKLMRYGANTLVQDLSWGINYPSPLISYALTYIIPRGDKLYCLGGFSDQVADTSSITFTVVNKSNAQILLERRYRYNTHSGIAFSKGVLDNDSILYVNGLFSDLNNAGRSFFAALSTNTGDILSWDPDFENTGLSPANSYFFLSPLYYNSSKLWFGTFTQSNEDSHIIEFPGHEIIDSATATRLPPLIQIKSYFYYVNFSVFDEGVSDMVFDTNYYYVAGGFDLVNGHAVRGILRMGYQNSSPPSVTISSITGSDILVAGADSIKYYIPNANTQLYSYYWTYTGTGVQIKNNGKDTVWLKASNNATSGILKVRVQNHCGLGSETQKSLTAGTVDLTIGSSSLSASSVATGNFFNVNFIVNNLGTQIAGPNKVNFYLSPNNILTPGSNGDILLGQYSITTNLPANGNTGSISKQLLMPCNTTAGNYFIFIVADGANEIPESNETNNQANITITATAGQSTPSTPVISSTPSITVCSPNTITLTANSNCASCSYTWSTGATGTSVTVNTSGTYSVTVTNNCGTATASQTVTINPSVVPSITINYTGCPDDLLIFQATPVNGGTNPQVEWFVNNVLRGAGQNFILNNATNGTQVYAKLTSNASCANPVVITSAVSTVNCIVTAIPNIDGLEEFKIMPNPSRGIFNVRLKLTQGKKVSFDIKDILGNRVYYTSPVLMVGSLVKTVDITRLSKGVYYLTTRIGTNSVTEKIVLQ